MILKIEDHNILYYINLNINKFIEINHRKNIVSDTIFFNNKLKKIGYIEIVPNFHNIIKV